MEHLKQLLPPKRREISEETSHIIFMNYCDLLSIVSSPRDAIYLLDTAEIHPHNTTQARLEENERIVLNNEMYDPIATCPGLFRAFDISTGQPILLKFKDAEWEYRNYEILGMTAETAAENHLVHLSRIVKQGSEDWNTPSKPAIVMPAFVSTLQAIPHLPEEVLHTRGVELLRALTYMHSLPSPVYHCDVKPSNIFVDMAGGWFLGDYGSIRTADQELYSTTDNYIPTNFVKKCGRPLDCWMFVISLLMKVPKTLLSVRQRPTKREVVQAIAALQCAELRHLLQGTVPLTEEEYEQLSQL